MTTYNTGNPIGSTDARDRLDNTENMDILENSTTLDAHPDRLGTMRKTRKGMESEHDAQIAAHETEHDNQMQSFEDDFDSRLAGMAFTRVGTFTAGATLTDMRQTLLWEVSQGGDGREYGWTGSFLPSGKVVAAGSSPSPISAGNWVDRTEDRLRSDINIVTKKFSHVAQMKAAIQLGDEGKLVEWVSYYDGWGSSLDRPIGGNTGIVMAAGTGIADEGSIFDTTSGLQVKALFNDGIVSAVRFGLKTNSSDSAVQNAAAIEKAVSYAYTVGSSVILPDELFYCDDVDVAYPVAIIKESSLFGARINKSASKSDIYHTGTGFLFNFLKQDRATGDVDGSFLCGTSIVGTSSGKGGFIVNDESALNNENYARRRFKAKDVSITGYKNGYGFKAYWSFSNTFENVTVLGCSVPYIMSSVYAVSHYDCIYESCVYGALELNCYASNHYGSTIEDMRDLSGYSVPADYDLLAGGMPIASGYIGIGLRVRGGNTNFFGGYLENNRIHFLTEDTSELCVTGAYINNSSSEVLHQASSGTFRMCKCRLSGNPTVAAYRASSPAFGCNYAQITDNKYLSMTKPTSVPPVTYVTLGEFDVYDGSITNNSNAAKRVFLGQELQVGGYWDNSGKPYTLTSEMYKTRTYNVGGSSVDRTVDLSSLSATSGFVIAAQASGTLTFSCSNANLANEGKELTIVVNSAGSCTVAFGTNMVASAPISLVAGKTINVTFKSSSNKWYQSGSVVQVYT